MDWEWVRLLLSAIPVTQFCVSDDYQSVIFRIGESQFVNVHLMLE
jgi:hypothetical protein